MNISVTNKSLLKGLVALAVACASSQVFAALPTSESFESYTADDAITNAAPTVWIGQGNDLSTVLVTNYTYTASTMPLSAPAPSTPQTKVLGLDTQGDELAYAPADDVAATGKVYIDQMVYLVPSDTAPTISDASVQAAVYLNADSNLVVYCRDVIGSSNAWAVLDSATVTPETWVRLTITMDYDTADAFTDVDYFSVSVNSNNVLSTSSTLGYATPINSVVAGTGGAWLRCANEGGGSITPDRLAGLSYTGTGMIDDLIITKTAPTFKEGGAPSTFSIVSVVGANGSISTDLDFSIAAGGSTSITFTAASYYEIDSLEINGVPVTDAGGVTIDFSTNHTSELTVDYTSVGANVSNNVTFTETLSDLTSAPGSWFIPLGLTPEGDDGTTPYTYMQAYLAGVNPTVSNAFTITGYTVSNGFLIVTWDGVDSPATPTAISALVAETVAGVASTNAGTAAFNAGTDVWTWESTSDTHTNGTLFIRLLGSNE